MDLDSLIRASLNEDLGPGDLATEATIPEDAAGRANIVAKEGTVVSGHRFAARVFQMAGERCGGQVVYEPVEPAGSAVASGTVIARVFGSMRGILVGERPALNLLMRACGIAARTKVHVDAAGDSGLRVVDTRKTTPLWRALEKAAVRDGGGHNHRFGLFDGCMLKDNHIAAVGSLPEAVRRARREIHHMTRICVECATLAQVREACEAGADVLMFDNMDNSGLTEAVALARSLRPDAVLEASGNMTAERIATLHGVGLDVVSVGGLIHHADWADLSLRVQP